MNNKFSLELAEKKIDILKLKDKKEILIQLFGNNYKEYLK